MENYKPNSHKYREMNNKEKATEKKVEKVVSGTTRVKKKSEAKKFADVFMAEDIENVKSYIFMDVLVPAVKKAISDVVTNGIDMILYGENGRTKKGSSSKVSYRSYYDRGKNNHSASSSVKRAYDYDDIILDNRGEAEDVLERMYELIDIYDNVSVADYYDLLGVSSDYTDNKYGWTELPNSSVVRVKDGYKIRLPKPMPL